MGTTCSVGPAIGSGLSFNSTAARPPARPQAEAWGYTDEARLRGLLIVTAARPHPEGWGYTDEARLRGLLIVK